MTVNTSGGSIVYIHRPDTATNPRYLNRLTGWVPIGEVESLSEIGETFGTIQRTYFSRGPRTESMKTVTTGKSVQLSIGFDVSDAGQTLLREAFTSRESYLFRVEINDAIFNDFVGTRLIFRALVTDQPFSIGSSDSVTYRNASIQINSEVFELPSESDIDADTSMIFDFVNNVARIDSANTPSQQTIAQAVTFTRASLAMYFDSSGVIRTAAENQIRFDYDPVTRESLGFLVEDARTNLLLRNTTLDVSPWVKLGDGVVVTDGAAIAPNGLMQASRIFFPSSIAGELRNLTQVVTNTGDGSYASSVWFRADTPTTLFMRGANYSLSAVSVGTTWQRYTRIWSSGIPVAPANLQFNLSPKSSSGNTSPATEVYMWCPQLEAGSFVSSEIITGATQVTRAADNMFALISSLPYSESEGTFVIDSQAYLAPTGAVPRVLHRGSLGRFMYTNQSSFIPRSYDGTNILQPDATGISVGNFYRYAVAWSGSTMVASANGNSVTTVPYVGAWGSGNLFFGHADYFSHIRNVRFISRRLSDSELMEVTAP